MTLYATPPLDEEDRFVVQLIEDLHKALRYSVQNSPRRWTGTLRRHSLAHAVQGSNSIEGYHATIDDVVAIMDDDEPLDANEEIAREIAGNARAMTFVLQLAEDDQFTFDPMVIRSLHFMMLEHAMPKMPGRWRPGAIFVRNEETGENVYEGPDAALVPGLIDELVIALNAQDGAHPLVKAAMAHLNLVMIHPFKDGNGRMARALQTLVLSRVGIVSPAFSSIEEWLGKNTRPYYQILADTGRGAWHPENDAHEWVRFNLRAYFAQANRIKLLNDFIAALYRKIDPLVQARKLPDRTTDALINAAIGLRVRANQYRTESDVSDVVASRDLRRLVDEGLLVPHGEKRGRYYRGSDELRRIALDAPRPVQIGDPYEIARKHFSSQQQPRLL